MTEPQLDPLPDGVLDKLRAVSTSTVATQLYKRGFRQPQLLGVRPLSQVVDGFVAGSGRGWTRTPAITMSRFASKCIRQNLV